MLALIPILLRPFGIQIAGCSHESADKVPRAPERRYVFVQVIPDKLWIGIIDQIPRLPKSNQFVYELRHALADGDVLVQFSVFFDEGNSSVHSLSSSLMDGQMALSLGQRQL